MVSDFFVLFSGTIPAAIDQYVNWKRAKENAPDAIACEALGEAARIHARYWDAARCDDPVRARKTIDECTLDLLNVISVIPHELAFLLIKHHDSCLEMVRRRDEA